MDGLFVTLYGLSSLVALSAGENGVATPFLGIGAAHTISAIVGNKRINRCKKAFAEHREWASSRRLMEDLRAAQPSNDRHPGQEGKACRTNLTCDPGLSCDQDANLCVPTLSATAGTAAPTATVAHPTDTANRDAADARAPTSPPATAKARGQLQDPWTAPPAAEAPAASPPAALAPPPPATETPPANTSPPAVTAPPPPPAPVAPVPDTPPPPNEPPPPAEDGPPWADFWRESNR